VVESQTLPVVELLLGEEEPSLDGERECLVPLLSSIMAKRRGREENPKERQDGMQNGYQHKTKGVFIAREVSHGYSNGCHFGSRAPTRVRHFENCASCTSYPDGQANCPTF
jgi:hypothetical protein